MKLLRIITFWSLSIIFTCLLGLFIYIKLHKEQIVTDIKLELNKSNTFEIDFNNPKLSIFSSFSKIQLSVEQLIVQKKNMVDSIPLFLAKEIAIDIDLLSIIKSNEPYIISELQIINPEINLIKYNDSLSNFDFSTQESKEQKNDTKEIELNIDSYTILNGKLSFTDQSINFITHISDIKVFGKGKIISDKMIFENIIAGTILNMDYGNITIAKITNLSFIGSILTDLKNNKYEFKDAKITLNDIKLESKGSLVVDNENLAIDAKFTSDKQSFKSFLSLIPVGYLNGTENFKTDGIANIDININGIYNETSFPHITISNQVENAFIQFPDKTNRLEHIKLDLKIDIKNLDDYTVNISKFHFSNMDNLFEGRLKISAESNDHFIDFKLKQDLDLFSLFNTLEIAGLDGMSGQILSNIELNGKLSDIKSNRFNQINFSGNSNIHDVMLKPTNYPIINIRETNINLSPKTIDIPNLNFTSNDEDINGFIIIKNPLAILFKDQTIEIESNLKSHYLNINHWFKPDISNIESNTTTETSSLDFKFTTKIKSDIIKYQNNIYKNNLCIVKGNKNQLNLIELKTHIGKSEVKLDGELSNYLSYLTNYDTLKGYINLKSTYINYNDFNFDTISTKRTGTTSTTLKIPKLIDIKMYTTIDHLKYDKIQMDKLNGIVQIKDQKLLFKNINCSAFGGSMKFDGIYNTKDKKYPSFSIKYDNKNLSFYKTFEQVKILQKLMPIIADIDGKLNSKLVFEGVLDNDYNIKPNSIIANGYLETLNASFKELHVFDNITKILGVNLFNNTKIENTKNWFTIKNGIVEIKEFDLKIKNISTKISGSHSIDQTINYIIKAHIPKKLFNYNPATSTLNVGMELISTKAKELGINIISGTHIDLNIYITGDLIDPQINIVPSGSSNKSGEDHIIETIKDKANEHVQEIVDSIRTSGEDLLKNVQDSLNVKKQEISDSLQKVIQKEKEKVVNTTKEFIKDNIDSTLINNVQDSLSKIIKLDVEDVLPKGSESDIDDIKKKIEEWNPFKKK